MSDPEVSAAEKQFLSAQWSETNHNDVLNYARESVHGSRFDLRPYHPDVPALQLRNVLLGARPDLAKFEDEVLPIGHILSANFNQLVAGIGEVLEDDMVATHRRNGGALIFASGHISYEDIALLMGGSTKYRLDAGEDIKAICNSQTLIAARLIATFMFGRQKVLEDIILRTGQVVQTSPDNRARKNSNVPWDVLKIFNNDARGRIAERFAAGDEGFVAASESEDYWDEDERTWYMHGVRDGAIHALIDPNQGGRRQVMVVPTFLRNQALDGDGTPDYTDFKFLEPTIPRTRTDVHRIHTRIAEAGTTTLQESPNEHQHGKTVVYSL